ncbi:hypothetical protein QAD02_007209 [Eretmocerus hayati]|uniref:Uncharacterized protein n=1 Tax=Eretmocerus hayati TaxID=131215 RepID=A0ACC2N5G7_9HYME|nr:hypothetical protein QAD02_007209 [Eretmocerus hayati]
MLQPDVPEPASVPDVANEPPMVPNVATEPHAALDSPIDPPTDLDVTTESPSVPDATTCNEDAHFTQDIADCRVGTWSNPTPLPPEPTTHQHRTRTGGSVPPAADAEKHFSVIKMERKNPSGSKPRVSAVSTQGQCRDSPCGMCEAKKLARLGAMKVATPAPQAHTSNSPHATPRKE